MSTAMSPLKYAVIAGALALGTFAAAPAKADGYCTYDRYGYHAPGWRGCGRVRYDWDGDPARPQVQIYRAPPLYRAYKDLPAAVYAAPVYGYGYRGGSCHYDNGWNNVIVVCD